MNEDALATLLFEPTPLQASTITIPTTNVTLSPQQVLHSFPSPTNTLVVPSHYAHAPLAQEVPTLLSHNDGKRRRQDTEVNTANCPSPTDWKPYPAAPVSYQVHDLITLVPITELIDITTQTIGSNFAPSPKDDTWICYRQNQFKVIVLFHSPQSLDSMCVNDGRGITRQITQVCAKLYAVGEVAGVMRDEMRVGLHIAGKSRRKSNKVSLDIAPFERGKIEFTNLQFEKSNAVKQNQVEFYHLVVAVYARCHDTDYHILSKISPRIVVRGQNPGFYDDVPKAEPNQQSVTQSTPSTPCTVELLQPTNIITNNFNVNNTFSFNSNRSPSLSPDSPNPPLFPLNPALQSSMAPEPSFPLSDTLESELNGADYPFTQIHIPQDLLGIDNVKSSLPPVNNSGFAKTPNYGTMVSTAEQRLGDERGDWNQIADTLYHYGKVGVNTSDPKEALHVQGNILVTGNMYKPSDQRIKSNIEPVDTGLQLRRLRRLKIYDYVVQSNNKQERGVLAQELETVMPEAVHAVGDAEIGGKNVSNLLVVNERTLLYENIGATKELDRELESEKANINNIDARVNNLEETTTEESSKAKRTMNTLMDIFFREEKKGKVSYAGLEEEYITFAFSVFRMGPARSLFVLGNFGYWAWAVGSVYIFSNVRERRILGWSCLANYVSITVLLYLYQAGKMDFGSIWTHEVSNYAVGAIILIVNYVRMRKKLALEKSNREQLMKDYKLPTTTEPCTVRDWGLYL